MGVMVSSALFGMMFGAIGLGVLGDKLGRRLAIAVCVLLFSVFTAAAGVARDPITFGVLRFIAGLGIGGVLPLCTALLTEYASASVRARFITIAACGYSIGGGLAALIGKALMEVFGWQVVFFAAGAPLILIPFILRFVPRVRCRSFSSRSAMPRCAGSSASSRPVKSCRRRGNSLSRKKTKARRHRSAGFSWTVEHSAR